MSLLRIIIWMCAALCLLPCAAFARAKVTLPHSAPLTAVCVAEAARASGLPMAALIGILATENGKLGEALLNNNGTWDMGPFQFNTVHINELADMGIAPEAVLQDGCTNAYAAAWLLRKEYNRTGDIWQAIGAYHSRTPHRRDAYIAQVKSNLARLSRSGIFALPLLAPDSAPDTITPGMEGGQ
ncbi:lytic transglycosylase domain-containing protein [Desulfovibrio sp.]|uniref:lytic transglycosylase domain-containing protein n=1 Tax=Desulfovibrio sp. TaxID=885 RepID=UPI0025C4EEF8|nr:lytic transglycosylase domain-containing protein [Desulfovibrio sp.]